MEIKKILKSLGQIVARIQIKKWISARRNNSNNTRKGSISNQQNINKKDKKGR